MLNFGRSTMRRLCILSTCSYYNIPAFRSHHETYTVDTRADTFEGHDGMAGLLSKGYSDAQRIALSPFVARDTCAIRYHMESGWAATELLELIDEELNPNREKQRASQAILDAIRVLPEPVAGDLFVTCTARGDVGVILFYFGQGKMYSSGGLAGQLIR